MPASLENYYLKQSEPYQSCLLALREMILKVDKDITHGRKFQIPFFHYKERGLAYLWLNGKKLMLGFVEDRRIQPVIAGIKNKDKYESIQIDPAADLPVALIMEKLNFYMDRIDRK